MSTSEVDSRSITISMRKSVENLVISSQDAIGQSISQAITFSGVITQHANQIMQETRNVSRSPSPSLRYTDGGPDNLDNDKCSETSLTVPSTGSGDSVSISSASELATVINVGSSKSENPKLVTSPNPGSRALDVPGTRTKKKSWYNALYPTYKSKSDDFKRLFKDLPDDERLIVDYSCALQKDILVHGRLYASQNYLCFYASIFGWETSMSLRWKDVTAITKEKTALVIPNAILVCTETEKNFLTSFSGRDKAYLMLFRVWQNALMDQPMTSQEIWQWVHSCYGEELGFNSDDEGYGRDFPEEAVLPPDSVSEDLADSSVEAGGGAESRDESRTRHASTRGSSPPLVTNGDASYREEEGGDTLPTDMSDSSDSEPEKPHNSGNADQCTANHEGRLLLQQEFPFNIDTLFTMIFTNSKFNLELLAARGTTDYVQAQWQPQGEHQCRQISYRLALTSGPIGPKEVQVTETQVMNKCSKPGVLYSIDSCSENAGIPYADYFSVHVHYCLRRAPPAGPAPGTPATALTVRARLNYKKSMFSVVKGFLEKNTFSGLEDYSRLLVARLTAEAESAAPTARKSRRQRRPASVAPETCVVSTAQTPAGAAGGARAGWALAALLLLLLAANVLLYWRLYHARPPASSHLPPHSMSGLDGEQAAQWTRLLQQHAARQRHQLAVWRTALDHTRAHLAQTEQAMLKLLETIKPSLETTPETPTEPPPPPPPNAEL